MGFLQNVFQIYRHILELRILVKAPELLVRIGCRFYLQLIRFLVLTSKEKTKSCRVKSWGIKPCR